MNCHFSIWPQDQPRYIIDETKSSGAFLEVRTNKNGFCLTHWEISDHELRALRDQIDRFLERRAQPDTTEDAFADAEAARQDTLSTG